MKRDILSISLKDLISTISQEYHEPSYRAKQIFQWLPKFITSFEDMTNLPKTLRERLVQDFYIGIPEITRHLVSEDATEKFLFRLIDNNVVEAVRIPYHHGDSVCISTQVGCKMGCEFCASGKNGFIRNLTAGEILGEIYGIQNQTKRRISNVSLMGTGEPLDNFEEILKFLTLIHHPEGMNLSYRHISLSTVGIVPRIYDLAKLRLPITLSISLHFPTDAQRAQMMPITKKYSLSLLMEAVRDYIKATNHRVTFEYTLIKGLNDSIAHAETLSHLVKNMLCHINLIPLNATENVLLQPSRSEVIEFQQHLIRKRLNVTIRRSAGADIAAACGQLRRSYIEDTSGVWHSYSTDENEP